mmetsp:Transcript_485/g.1079  ORF Transcript_485/g.1079 Transcript_485/m.1079 type:complete len:391 (-) Transcript_485:64-1236(-)
MKAFFTPMHIGVVLSCILIQETKAGIDNNTPNNNDPEVNVNEITNSADDDGSIGNIHRSSNDSDASSQTSSSFTSASSTTGNGNNSNSSNNIHQNGSNGHSKNYYNNNNQNNDNEKINAKYDDEQTYLDLFGERAKELFTQHIIPSTDAECRWDWRMGRCEPYCSCGLQFLWGDYHIGRSCRLRPNPPPSQFARGDVVDSSEEEVEETSWQEAWQEVWQSQLTEGTVDDSSNFVPPLSFPKRPPATEETSSWDRTSTTCTLPPESRYIQIIHQLTKTVTHSTIVIEQYQKLKNATSDAVNTTMVHGQHHWTNLRQKACETVKNKVGERAQIRNQPVVLTRQGATWIRRVCGTADGSIRRDDDQTDSSDAMKENLDGVNEEKEDIAEDELE